MWRSPLEFLTTAELACTRAVASHVRHYVPRTSREPWSNVACAFRECGWPDDGVTDGTRVASHVRHCVPRDNREALSDFACAIRDCEWPGDEVADEELVAWARKPASFARQVTTAMSSTIGAATASLPPCRPPPPAALALVLGYRFSIAPLLL